MIKLFDADTHMLFNEFLKRKATKWADHFWRAMKVDPSILRLSAWPTLPIKEDQHYIPKFLLKKFAENKSNGFKVFDKEKGYFLRKIQHPKGTMVAKFFYEHRSAKINEIENLLSSRETIYADLLNRIISGQENITEGDYRTLVEFRHVTYYRSSEFFAFHTHRKNRGPESWWYRMDWRMLNFIYKPASGYEESIKKSQIDAIRRTIAGEEEILKLSLMTPLCFLFESTNNKFVIGDSGSISMGGEFDGLAIIVISPRCALMFPKVQRALEIISERNIILNEQQPILIRETIPDELVDMLNDHVKHRAYRYWVETPDLFDTEKHSSS